MKKVNKKNQDKVTGGAQGGVKGFNESRGFDYIGGEDFQDLLAKKDFRTLDEGQRVEFETAAGSAPITR